MSTWMPIVYRFCRLLPAFVGGLSLGSLGDAPGFGASPPEPQRPMIVGYERYGRHGEVESAVAGDLLISELSCTACHARSAASDRWKPKLGPRLDGAGTRLSPEWIERFLLAPQHVKPGTTMPDMLAGFNDRQKATIVIALTAFLETLQAGFVEPVASGANPIPHQFWLRGEFARGERLYHQVGCVACHAPHEDYEAEGAVSSMLDTLIEELEPDELERLGLSSAARLVPSVSLAGLAEKYSLQSLTYFLIDPLHDRPAGRMPNLRLTATEAADIAAYLLRDQDFDAAPVREKAAASLIDEGANWFKELRCVNCHSLPGMVAESFAEPLLNFVSDDSTDPVDLKPGDPEPAGTQGCLGAPSRFQPHFELDQQQRTAIIQVLQAASQSSATDIGRLENEKTDAGRSLELTLLQLNCLSCHQRHELGGVARGRSQYFKTVGHVDLGDEGRLPPPLSHVGSKLTSSAISKVLEGKGDVRPYLQIRMPRYPPSVAKGLVEKLLAADLPIEPQNRLESSADEMQAAAQTGRALFDVGCVQCHPMLGESLASVVGIDLATTAVRVNRDWFEAFLMNPASLKPRTRMPSFFAKDSVNREFFDGDASKQIDSLWQYLTHASEFPLPDKIEQARAQNYELTPTTSPLMLRTFMRQAGMHAIAVGFPEKLNFAFDAEQSRLAQIWQGRFVDARGTWFDRFAPPAVPLGDAIINLPEGACLALLAGLQAAWPQSDTSGVEFLGYRLDEAGIPTFDYQLSNWIIHDRLEPTATPGLRRRLSFEPAMPPTREDSSQDYWLRVHAATRLERINPTTYRDNYGLSISLTSSHDGESQIRQTDKQQEWLLPLSSLKNSQVQWEYQW